MRLFNPKAAEITVRLTFRGDARTVTLAPKELKEIPDVLGTLFGVTEDARDLLQIGLNQAIAMARTASGAQFGEMAGGAASAGEHPRFGRGRRGVGDRRFAVGGR